MFRRRLPVPPENVRLVDAEGQVFPLELAWTGRHHGLDCWRATALIPIDPDRGFRLLVDEIPDRCLIEVLGRRP
jgi:hypothetical protein